MWICPVCETNNDTLSCTGCGFDGSCNYDDYPTLGRLLQATDTIRRRREKLEEEQKQLVHCPVCKGHW